MTSLNKKPGPKAVVNLKSWLKVKDHSIDDSSMCDIMSVQKNSIPLCMRSFSEHSGMGPKLFTHHRKKSQEMQESLR